MADRMIGHAFTFTSCRSVRWARSPVDSLRSSIVVRTTIRYAWIDVLLRHVNATDRVWIAHTRSLSYTDLDVVHRLRNIHVGVVLDRVLLQAGLMSQRDVWWARKSDGRTADRHSILRRGHTSNHTWQHRRHGAGTVTACTMRSTTTAARSTTSTGSTATIRSTAFGHRWCEGHRQSRNPATHSSHTCTRKIRCA